MTEPWIVMVRLWFQFHVNADFDMSVNRKVEASKAVEQTNMQQNKSLHIGTV